MVSVVTLYSNDSMTLLSVVEAQRLLLRLKGDLQNSGNLMSCVLKLLMT